MEELTYTLTFAQNLVSMLLWFTILVYILTVIATWKIFTKAGENGIKALIPFYNVYILYKICWETKFFWYTFGLWLGMTIVNNMPNEGFLQSLIYLVIVIANLDISAKFCTRLAQSFGKGKGFAIGLFFLPPIFQLILGFGNGEYQRIEERKE